ncbi:MAG: TonB-dependent receptor plug domain-containing protein [Prevotella sp.]
MKRNVALALICLFTLNANALKEDTDTVVVGTRDLKGVTITEKASKRQVSSTSPLHSINKEKMRVTGTTDIADALNRLPGITLRDYGGAGGMKTVSVRSFGAQHTGVSYDGIMLSDCQSGQIDVARYSLDNVDNITLIIGDNDDIFIPAKSAATPATLNIRTQGTPNADNTAHVNAQMKVGSFGYVSPFVRYTQNVSERLMLSATGEYTYADNDYPYTLKNVSIVTKDHRTNSRMKQWHGEINAVWKVGRTSLIDGKVYYYDNDRQLPGQVRYYTNNSKEQLHDRNFFAQMQYRMTNSRKLSFKYSAKFNWSASDYKDLNYKDGVKDAEYWQREFYNTACLLYTPTEQWSFDYSADYAFNNLGSTLSTETRPFRHTLLQSATARLKTGRFTAIARLLYSLYYNNAKDGASARDMKRLSPSLSLSYKVFRDREMYIRASYKNIFRVPTFQESYFFHYGSTTLEPENTDQYNIGVTWMSDKNDRTFIKLTLDGYLNHIKDKIVAVPYNMFVWTNINVGKVKVLGLDATADMTRIIANGHKIVFSATYSLQNAENRTNSSSPYYGNQIAYIPKHSGSASLGYENPYVNISVHGTGTSLRYSNNEHYEDSEVSGYWEMGVTAYKDFNVGKGKLSTRLDLKNILDKQYEIVKLYPMPGISYMFSVGYKF